MKKTGKKVLVSAFALATAFSLAACGSQQSTTATAKYKDLVVNSQEFSGDFFKGAFSNSLYDTQAISLTDDTSTVVQTANGKFVVNKAVVTNETLDKKTDEVGNTVVTWNIRKDLKWSNGKAVTAKDYVFSTLFQYSKAWAGVGAQVVVDPALVGVVEYAQGTVDTIKGLKLIDDYTFSITIDKEALPYFYEMSYYGFDAISMEEVAKDAKIISGENGAKIEGVDLKTVAENVKATQVDSRKPTATYGKYVMDKSSETELVFKLNPNYQGNYEGVKPTIETITLKANKNSDLAVQRLLKGEVDFVPNITDAAQIEKAKSETATVGMTRYERNGYGYLAMTNEFGPTKDVNVRHAIAHITNRNKLITDVLGGNGVAINSQYTLASWMAKEKESELNSKLNKYSYDIVAANAALDKSAYQFEADGVTKFDASKASETYLRYNANKEVLEVNHLTTENNPVSTALETGFRVDAPKVGMKYNVTKTDFPTLQKEIKLVTVASPEQKFHLFNLATNYVGAIFDPYNNEHSKNLGTYANSYRVNDAQIDKLSEEMRKVDSSNTDAFANKWLEYQVRFNEILPVLPLYSNIYYNAYSNEKVATDPTTSIRDWARLVEYFKLK